MITSLAWMERFPFLGPIALHKLQVADTGLQINNVQAGPHGWSASHCLGTCTIPKAVPVVIGMVVAVSIIAVLIHRASHVIEPLQ